MDLTDYELSVFREAFGYLDTDDDKYITISEIRTFVNKMGEIMSDADLSILMNRMDIDGIGSIVLDSFIQTLINIMSTPPTDDILRETFQIYDDDRTGFITVDNLRSIFIQLNLLLPTEEIEQMIHQYDQDGDGCLSYDEFVSTMTDR